MSQLPEADLLRIHAKRLIQRDIDQLLGICEFALQDGHIDQDEAENLMHWMTSHPECLSTWPASVLFDRLRCILADGVIAHDEHGELLQMVMQIAAPRRNDGTRAPSTLPLNDPAPPIIFAGRRFCFTGAFEFGSRAQCQDAVTEREGIPIAGITRKLHYLVIGSIGSEVWRHSSFGAKILKAVDYRDNGIPIAIIDEHHWASHLR